MVYGRDNELVNVLYKQTSPGATKKGPPHRYLEGARWDMEAGCLARQLPKQSGPRSIKDGHRADARRRSPGLLDSRCHRGVGLKAIE
jgi:hypothetical protein